MTPEHAPPHRDVLLSAGQLRELMRTARSFVPDRVARALLHRHPAIRQEDAQQTAELLEQLVDAARRHLADAGIGVPLRQRPERVKVARREREGAERLCALLTHLACSLALCGKEAAARRTAAEGIAWGRLSGNRFQYSIAWGVMSAIHGRMVEPEAEESACRCELEAARMSANIGAMLMALHHLARLMVNRGRMNEAEQAADEGLALAGNGAHSVALGPLRGLLLMDRARIAAHRGEDAECLQMLLEAERCCDAISDPLGRLAVLSRLAEAYRRLDSHRTVIDLSENLVQLAGAAGARAAAADGYCDLAESHIALGAPDRAAEALGLARELLIPRSHSLPARTIARCAGLYAAIGRNAEGMAIAAPLPELPEVRRQPELRAHVHATLGTIEAQMGNHAAAADHYRLAIESAPAPLRQRARSFTLRLAEALHNLGRDTEATALLAEIVESAASGVAERAAATRLRAAIAERRGDLHTVIELERAAFALGRQVIEEQSERSLRSAQVIARTDLQRCTADLELERRYRAEREQAATTGDERERAAIMVEERLRKALTRTVPDQGKAIVQSLHQALTSMRTEGTQSEAEARPRFTNGVEAEFYLRLRERWPDLTPKQERLCGLLRAGLRTHEISALLGLEPEGLKAQRKRLRKKLGLPQQERLEQAIAAI
ncbi:MAG: hypothetical protein JST22_20930 [Bacteroidetes bacterium]|nr:hypothetical protein [Bacteroidota bacterium]